MNAWAAPLALIVALIFAVLLFLTQDPTKKLNPELPDEAGTFQPISLSPAQGQTQGIANAGQQQQTQQQPQQQQQQQLQASYSATIKTTKGDIIVSIRVDAAPNTAVNFLNKAVSGYYNNLTFHRVEDWVVQGGDPKGNGTGGGDIPVEFNSLPFVAGSIGAASRGDGRVQNDSQFFITKTDASWLNGQYTNFGQVTGGMDVVNKMTIGDKILGITVEGIN